MKTTVFLLALSSALALMATGIGQAIYETDVNVVTIAGKVGLAGERNGTGDEVLLGVLFGMATIGDDCYVLSEHQGTHWLKKVVGRTVTTLAARDAENLWGVRESNPLVADPVRSSLLWTRTSETLRLNLLGQSTSLTQFLYACSVSGNSASYATKLPQREHYNGLSVLDFPSGKATSLAGGILEEVRDGVGEEAGFYSIRAIAASEGLIYVNDYYHMRVVSQNGTVTTLASQGSPTSYRDGSLFAASIGGDFLALAVDKDDNLVFSQGRRCIRRLANNTVLTMAGSLTVPGALDGEGSNARFTEIRALSVDASNRLWVADQNCIRMVVFKESQKNTPAELGIRAVPGITVTGEVGGVYRIEYKEALAGSTWQLLRVVALAQPVQEFYDYEARGNSRYYRVVTPP